MIVGSRTLLRLRKVSALPATMVRSYSSAAAEEYHSLNDQALHSLENPVQFQGEKAPVFDATSSNERRFVPFEIKELSFKCGMGFLGIGVLDNMYHFSFLSEIFAAGFVLNWAYRTMTIMGSTVRKIELNSDGKTVTVTPRIGNEWNAKISDFRKLKHEKDLI